MPRDLIAVFTLAIAASTSTCTAEPPKKADADLSKFKELGAIRWTTDRDAAQSESKRTGRPVMLLFTELPGCHGCVRYGQTQLSHPLVVDASKEFVPVAVAYVGWPKVHYLDGDAKHVIRPIGHSRDIGPLVRSMRDALKANGKSVPAYLELAAAEYAPREPQRATFAMACFWTGEVALGSLDGVIETKSGFFPGAGEVVDVLFDAEKISYAKLLEEARKMRCARKVIARNDRQYRLAITKIDEKNVVRSDKETRISEKDTHYHLRRRPAYYYLPLTMGQATKVNAALGKARVDELLSPTQLKLKSRLQSMDRALLVASGLAPQRKAHEVAGYAATLQQWVDRSNRRVDPMQQ